MALERELFRRGRQVFVLDGDTLRTGLNSDLGFKPEHRVENIRRAAEVGKLFAEAGMIVISSLISPYAVEREKARNIVGDAFREIYVKADLATCESRDPKGLYKRARAGEIPNFTGISAPYEAPEQPDLVVDTSAERQELSVKRLLDFVEATTALRNGPDRLVG
jgi:bifunctional enzyme CysN/CysC